jgi:hypothetical protein
VIRFRAGPVLAEIQARAVRGDPAVSLGHTARRDLSRYYTVLRASLPRFTEPEASLLLDALNGVLLDEYTYRLLWAEVDDAIRLDGLDRKWGVHGGELVTRLRNLGPAECMAVLDAVERAWLLLSDGSGRTVGDVLREVGLVAP